MSTTIGTAQITSEKIKDLELTIKQSGEDNYRKYKYILELEEKLSRRALKVAARIHADFLDYEETNDADENYKLLMAAMRKQTNDLNKAN